MNSAIETSQKEMCDKYGVVFYAAPFDMKLGISSNVREGVIPVNGLRHSLEGDTTGWYIWSGEELSTDPDYFKPLHVEHLLEWCPEILKYLGLPPGSRFLVAGDYEDVWYDKTLLNA